MQIFNFSKLKKDSSTLAANKTIEEYQPIFDIYQKLPEILTIIHFILCFIWSILDVSIYQDSITKSVNSSYYGHDYVRITYYGVMHIKNSWFLAMLIWWAIGFITGLIQCFLLKLITSYPILHIAYLRKISENQNSNSILEESENTSTVNSTSTNNKVNTSNYSLTNNKVNTSRYSTYGVRWICSSCGESNNPKAMMCINCGESKQK